MLKSVSFIYNNNRYITIFGCGTYLDSIQQEWEGITKFTDIISKGGYSATFLKEFGMQPNAVPILSNAVVTQVRDNYVVVDGTLTIDGVIRKVHINQEGLTIEGDEPESEAVESSAEETAPAPEEEKPVVAEEPVTEVETPVEEEAPAEVEESVPEPVEQSVTESVEPEPNVAEPEPKFTETVVEEEIPTTEEPVREEVPVVSKPEVKAKVPVAESTPGRVKEVDCSIGFHMGELNPALTDTIVGTNTNTAGFFIRSEIPVRNQEAKVVKPVQPSVKHISKLTGEITPTTPTKSIISNELKDLASRWSGDNNSNVESEDTDTDTARTAEMKRAAKDRLRTKFSEEVNAIIGDIPHSLLGDINEFTLKPINREELDSAGIAYCISNRWHKCGNWFCIDIVTTKMRAFYNNKQSKYIEVPVEDCKAWLKAVS